MTDTRLHKIWMSMRDRCLCKTNKSYKEYGERGITICNEWSSFSMFYEWSMNNGYKSSLSIDRIDNDDGYKPDNCRWVNNSIQQRNTRKICKNNTSGYRGVTYENKKYRARIMVDRKKIHIGYYNNPVDAALAYDKYVNDNNLEHTINFINKEK